MKIGYFEEKVKSTKEKIVFSNIPSKLKAAGVLTASERQLHIDCTSHRPLTSTYTHKPSTIICVSVVCICELKSRLYRIQLHDLHAYLAFQALTRTLSIVWPTVLFSLLKIARIAISSCEIPGA